MGHFLYIFFIFLFFMFTIFGIPDIERRYFTVLYLSKYVKNYFASIRSCMLYIP